MSWRKTLSDCLMVAACLLLVSILVFVSFVGPRTGWLKSAKTEAGKSSFFLSDEAPATVHFASIGVLIGFPVYLMGSILARPREPVR